MKHKHGIFRWFRRKRPTPIAITNDIEKKKNIIVKEEPIHKVEDINPINNTTISPIPIVSNEKENERELPIRKNERITLVKPKRTVGITPIKEEIKKEKKIEDPKEIIEEKNLVQHKTISNDVTIKTDALDEIEKMLKTNYYEVQNIKYELEVLEQKEQDEIIIEEVEKLIEELNKLIKRFEEIKKDFYRNNFDKISLSQYNDSYIGQLIEEYKTSIKDNNISENILREIKQIEEYITLINDIIDIESKKDTVNKKLDDKKESLGLRDKEFEDLKDKYVDVEKMNNYIESFSQEYDHIIKTIEEKVEAATTITKKAEYKSELAINYTRLLTSTLPLASTSMIPFNRSGNILKMGLMMASVAGIASSINVRTKESKVITKIDFIDYEKEILSNINTIDNMSLMLDKTIIDIKNIKDEFQKEFGEYTNLIPEYYELLSNLDSIEKDLLVKQDIVKEYDKKLEKTLEQNNVKVKRLEEEIFD